MFLLSHLKNVQSTLPPFQQSVWICFSTDAQSEYPCLIHVGFQDELSKCALICIECKLLAKPNENTCILKRVKSYLVKWIKELK